jgi:hypothetical protein
MDSIEKKEIHVDGLFEQYLKEESCLSILSTFNELCDILGLSNETNKRVLQYFSYIVVVSFIG